MKGSGRTIVPERITLILPGKSLTNCRHTTFDELYDQIAPRRPGASMHPTGSCRPSRQPPRPRFGPQVENIK